MKSRETEGYHIDMSVGVCCQWLEKRVRPRSGDVEYVNSFDERSLQLGRFEQGKYTPEMIKGTYVHNARRLSEMLPIVHRSGIKLFRISSAMFPLADKVDQSLLKNDEVRKYLTIAGDFIRANGMRVTTHPGQFCVLSSDSDSVVEKAFVELSIHGWMFDEMGLDKSPKYAINIHGGKSDRSSRLIEQVLSLPENVRKRLTLENDETAYSLIDLLSVFKETSVPVVFDSHHHVFNDGELSMEDAHMLSCETWPKDVKPLQHLSNTQPGLEGGSFTEKRKHSDMIHYVPVPQLGALRNDEIDVEVEAKMKNISVIKLMSEFAISA